MHEGLVREQLASVISPSIISETILQIDWSTPICCRCKRNFSSASLWQDGAGSAAVVALEEADPVVSRLCGCANMSAICVMMDVQAVA